MRYEPEQETELLTTILEETDRLNRLVGNILDLAEIRRGGADPAPQGTPRSTRSVEAVDRPHAAAAWTGSRLELSIPRPTFPRCRSTGVQMDQVLTNLLENAARYSPDGGEVR